MNARVSHAHAFAQFAQLEAYTHMRPCTLRHAYVNERVSHAYTDGYACTLRHACMNARVCVCHIQRRWLQHTLRHSHIYTHILTHMHKGLLIGKTLRQRTFNRILASNAIRTLSPLATLAGKATHLGACGEGRSTDTRVISSFLNECACIPCIYVYTMCAPRGIQAYAGGSVSSAGKGGSAA